MALGWVSLLKTVPWADVISTAPAVTEGAKRLWTAVSKKPPAAPPDVSAAPPAPSAEQAALVQLQARADAAEARLAELHAQMVASSELITTLASQNAELVRRVEANRVRLVWLSVGTVVAFGLAAVLWAVGMLR